MQKEKRASGSLLPEGGLTYSPETRHLFPKEVQHFFEVVSQQAPTQPKYYRVQKDLVIRDTKKLFKENPEAPVREVVLNIISTLPDFLPPKNIHDVVGYITLTWEQCQQAQTKKSPTRELATI